MQAVLSQLSLAELFQPMPQPHQRDFFFAKVLGITNPF
jgi:hypothetical protein